MDELIILDFQAKEIADTLRKVANRLKSNEKVTSLDRDILQSIGFIKNVIDGKPNEIVTRDC
jgi:hypothetical protein